MIIQELRITPIAIADPPLLNADGVHQPHVLRAVVELVVSDGRGGKVTGLGECAGHAWQLDWLELVGSRLPGTSVYETGALALLVRELLTGRAGGVEYGPDAPWRRWADRADPPESRGPAPVPAPAFDIRRVYAALEVACLDAQGRLAGVPVVDLLGGRVRDTVPYSGYLFYKWAGHPGSGADEWGAALTPDGVVAQARRMVDLYGFRSLKLKGGVFAPDEEIAALRALRAEFPDHPLRLDPNAAWTMETALAAVGELADVLEYLEDPVAGVEDMAAVAARTPLPLATNMCVTSLESVRPAVERGAVRIVLGDHHIWGGLRATVALGDVCRAVGWGLSMHSNSHLGISLAAMTHAAAATAALDHACDTHYPWNAAEDVVVPGALPFTDGSVAVPCGPGLGVELDRAAVDRLHAVYLALGREHRDDTAYLRSVQPEFDPKPPRW
ncbi:glucarate dehydratase [Streptomyces sp. KM273126]|uniref:enolase C-terminal domain-like protein n=1 Tax=Streptomyces sp. KM273126 TaxID=2545247 RepID=UPI00103B67AF|nr:enolase C-terminal domain-like protein [Streptomyces sp. KM273126]MBA2813262.1 glucarate dehydratase [Streptomyces sp. KM273126]